MNLQLLEDAMRSRPDGGVLVFTLNSMAHITFSSLASLRCVGGVVTVLRLPYLGVVIVLMMVMEMVIMAVSMIAYMMNPAGLMPMSMLHNKRGALAISAVVFAALVAGIFAVPWPKRTGVRLDPTLTSHRRASHPHQA